MKKQLICLSIALVLSTLFIFSQTPKQMANARKWVNSRVWAPKSLKATPHPSVNAYEFQQQYMKNKAVWDAVFLYMANKNLSELPLGKEGLFPDNKCNVTISKYIPKDKSAATLERHQKFIDLQYTLSGNEMMGLADRNKAEVKSPYNPTKDLESYVVDDKVMTYYPTDPNVFFLFFPSDVHHPSVKPNEGYNGEESFKVVFKIAVAE